MIDLRNHRREAFVKWYVWGARTNDIDPALAMLRYIFKRQELNEEQKLWICWLYGCTYYLPTAYLIWNEFPDYENVGIERLEEWNSKNYKRLRYQTDTKYNKGHLPKMFLSYKKACGASQIETFQKLLKGDTRENYRAMDSFVKNNFYKFGRYTSWFYLQALRDCCGISLDADSLLLGRSGSKSHTRGMCFAAGKDEWAQQDSWTEEQIEFLEDEAYEIILEISHRFPDVEAEYFKMETALCSFKKLFRFKHGRYLGYYLDRQAEEIRQLEQDGWSGVDWELLWQQREEELPLWIGARGRRIKECKMKEFLETGWLKELEYYGDLT